jgi:hypothetical protein
MLKAAGQWKAGGAKAKQSSGAMWAVAEQVQGAFRSSLASRIEPDRAQDANSDEDDWAGTRGSRNRGVTLDGVLRAEERDTADAQAWVDAE